MSRRVFPTRCNHTILKLHTYALILSAGSRVSASPLHWINHSRGRFVSQAASQLLELAAEPPVELPEPPEPPAKPLEIKFVGLLELAELLELPEPATPPIAVAMPEPPELLPEAPVEMVRELVEVLVDVDPVLTETLALCVTLLTTLRKVPIKSPVFPETPVESLELELVTLLVLAELVELPGTPGELLVPPVTPPGPVTEPKPPTMPPEPANAPDVLLELAELLVKPVLTGTAALCVASVTTLAKVPVKLPELPEVESLELPEVLAKLLVPPVMPPVLIVEPEPPKTSATPPTDVLDIELPELLVDNPVVPGTPALCVALLTTLTKVVIKSPELPVLPELFELPDEPLLPEVALEVLLELTGPPARPLTKSPNVPASPVLLEVPEPPVVIPEVPIESLELLEVELPVTVPKVSTVVLGPLEVPIALPVMSPNVPELPVSPEVLEPPVAPLLTAPKVPFALSKLEAAVELLVMPPNVPVEVAESALKFAVPPKTVPEPFSPVKPLVVVVPLVISPEIPASPDVPDPVTTLVTAPNVALGLTGLTEVPVALAIALARVLTKFPESVEFEPPVSPSTAPLNDSAEPPEVLALPESTALPVKLPVLLDAPVGFPVPVLLEPLEAPVKSFATLPVTLPEPLPNDSVSPELLVPLVTPLAAFPKVSVRLPALPESPEAAVGPPKAPSDDPTPPVRLVFSVVVVEVPAETAKLVRPSVTPPKVPFEPTAMSLALLVLPELVEPAEVPVKVAVDTPVLLEVFKFVEPPVASPGVPESAMPLKVVALLGTSLESLDCPVKSSVVIPKVPPALVSSLKLLYSISDLPEVPNSLVTFPKTPELFDPLELVRFPVTFPSTPPVAALVALLRVSESSEPFETPTVVPMVEIELPEALPEVSPIESLLVLLDTPVEPSQSARRLHDLYSEIT
ncbi:hypothetical protein VNI00_014464 [Paramarasmius palmivorus]|uniref:Uncharacterized protein n=1 Tax=Paramarasmius palmivorus TaxID=297713 RepID=A0AAW0BSL6_9AGAR